jgi:hypothetical protein
MVMGTKRLVFIVAIIIVIMSLVLLALAVCAQLGAAQKVRNAQGSGASVAGEWVHEVPAGSKSGEVTFVLSFTESDWVLSVPQEKTVVSEGTYERSGETLTLTSTRQLSDSAGELLPIRESCVGTLTPDRTAFEVELAGSLWIFTRADLRETA